MFTEIDVSGIRARVAELRNEGGRVALVPTMGALHEGHLALVTAARSAADIVVVSIFVNPLQFAPGEDFARYPRTLESDAAKLEEHGVSVLFAPSASVMYGDMSGSSRTTVLPGSIADRYEGAIRPGHFAGVLTVVAKLFNMVQPDVAVFGRKDLQQLAVIRAMVRDLDFPVEIRAVETVREPDGLALSSRNRYLDETARQSATAVRAALLAAREAFRSGVTAPAEIQSVGRALLDRDASLALDYFALVREADFETPSIASRGDAVIAAVRAGATRLIDNISL